ncbi:transposase [Brevibacterium sp. JNUCC-42]|nr:transposase [Brevibacterium sp. JNUCC-42]
MLYSLVARIVEWIPTVKDLRKRLKHDFIFRMECGFLFSDSLPSEASYSRLVHKLSETAHLEKVQDKLLLQAIQEGFIGDEAITIDAAHFESRDLVWQKKKRRNQN